MKTWKDRVKSDYSEIRGVHHGPREGVPMEQLDRELEYAQRLRINSVRVGIGEEEWHKMCIRDRASIPPLKSIVK